MSDDRPVVRAPAGAVRGIWRGDSAAFLGIPFAKAPVGELRFAAPVAATPWTGTLDASAPGPTPQRRPFAEVTTIPEPSFPGDATLNLNVFTPAPGRDSGLPVLVWIHGGGFFAGSPSSPWYDGASYNRDGVVTVSLSYRLGFDGFGWIDDAPTNRGLRDLIAGLEWVRDNIAAFGGDPSRVTIAGQSAGGSAVLALLASPLADGLFSQVIAHSAADLSLSITRARVIGHAFAERAGVGSTRAGWSGLDEDAVLDAQTALMAPTEGPPANAAAFVRGVLAVGGVALPFVPLVGDDVLPVSLTEALRRGGGTRAAVLAGTVAHEFTPQPQAIRLAWSDSDPVQALSDAGVPRDAARAYVEAQPEFTWTADLCGQVLTDRTFRMPLLAWADGRPLRTWLYDFRWPAPGLGLSTHCLELPFTWDVLDEAAAVVGPHPPQELADAMHGAWVRFITSGDPGWPSWDGHNAHVFGAGQADTYSASRTLAAALAARSS
ncbi:MAG TPA: carboxylesterase family protein [Propionicimonas sp.]|jgi:para-nitrobenzyl esterase|uniref:carboxylesterase/lipase family protein n=1 Tax=Propionicimonas sp. TaxID=1955623 RepID=UPI002F42C3D6